MNLSSFSANDFEPVNWINESFKQNKDKEKFASETVLKLQSFIQEINKSLEDSSKKIIVNLGKVKGELTNLNEHAVLLKSDLDNVQAELRKIQIENDSPTMSKLFQINELKTRMQQTSISLKEADNWSTLSREMESVIQKSDLDTVATKLICMQKSLNILTNVPDYLQRVNKLNEFKATFIQSINPKLSSLFSSLINDKTNQTELDKYLQIFKELNKLDSFKEVYQESVCHQLILEWQNIKNLSLKDTIIDWINSYFDLLSQTLINQIKIVKLFNEDDDKECPNILVSIFTDLFSKINDDVIRNLAEFVELKKCNFIDLVNSLILTKNLFDKLSKNFYNNLVKIDLNFKENNQSMQLIILINSPYRHVLEKYFKIEQEMLKRNFSEIKETNQQLVTEYVTKIFQIARDSEKRCYLLTNSVYLPKFIVLIESNFNQSIDYFQSLLNSIKLKEDQEMPDWNLFQNALFYLQSFGDFIVQFDCFQQQIFNSWLDLKNKISNCDVVVQNYSLLYLNLDDQTTLYSIQIENCKKLFSGCFHRLITLCNEMLNLVLSIPISFINGHLAQIEQTFDQQQMNYKMTNNQDNEDIFKLSLTPNEYITQVGQYLLTIPQHIEHFIIQENISLKCVFKHFDQTKFIGADLVSGLSSQSIDDLVIKSDDVAEFFLSLLVQKIVQLFVKRIQNLNLKNRKDRLHLIADIEYLNEVIDDLGLPENRSLTDLVNKLKN